MVTADYTDPARRFTQGPIVLQHHNPVTSDEFRRIEIKELTPESPPTPVTPVLPPPTKEEPFLPLFNGKDLAGWKTPSGQVEKWRVDNGILMGPGKKASYLYSERSDFKNFHLRAKARVTDGSNGGIYLRAPDMAAKRPLGYKALLNFSDLDLSKAGSLFSGFSNELQACRESLVQPGKWFTLDVIAVKNQITVKIDGKQSATYTDEKQAFNVGHLVLEQADSQTAIDFETIEYRELSADAKVSALDPGPGPVPAPKAFGPAPGPGGPKVVLNMNGVFESDRFAGLQ